MRALITGIAGFAGSHLADWLLSQGDLQVAGVLRPGSGTSNLAHSRASLQLYEADLTNEPQVREIVADWAPDRVYHLAAQASVAVSWQRPAETLEVNTVAQLNLLTALADCGAGARVLVVGSADVYGQVSPDELPLTEDSPLRPANPYALSKVTQDLMGRMFAHSRGLHVVRVRPFNHIGPRQRTGFVAPDFCQQIAEIEAGRQRPTMLVGNLSARRDFSDVRDVVRAYWLALERGQPGEVYNICSGASVAIQELLDRLVALSTAQIAIEPDPLRLRPSDTPELFGSAALLTRQTGWRPTIPLGRSLADALAYWRGMVAATSRER